MTDKKSKSSKFFRNVVVAFVTPYQDPFTEGRERPPVASDLSAILETTLDQYLKREDLRRPGFVLSALLHPRSPLYAGKRKSGSPPKESVGEIQRVLLFWNPISGKDEGLLLENAKRLKVLLEHFFPHLSGAVETVRYCSPDTRALLDDLSHELERHVAGENQELTRFVFLLGGGQAQVNLMPVELGWKRAWTGRFLYFMYGTNQWDVKNLFKVGAPEHSHDLPRPLVSFLDEARLLEPAWGKFLDDLLRCTIFRRPVVLVGGTQVDHVALKEWLARESDLAEGVWRPMLTVASDHEAPTEEDLGLHRILWVDGMKVSASVCQRLSESARLLVDRGSIDRSIMPQVVYSFPGRSPADTLPWSKTVKNRCVLSLSADTPSLLVKLAWRAVVEDLGPGGGVQDWWCAPCTRPEDHNDSHTCIESELVNAVAQNQQLPVGALAALVEKLAALPIPAQKGKSGANPDPAYEQEKKRVFDVWISSHRAQVRS